MKRQEIDLVHVVWDDDQGIVSLKNNKVIFYCWSSRWGGHHSFVPTVGIEDADFKLLMPPTAEGVCEATWDDVPRLLHHPHFPLMKRAEFPRDDD